MSKVWVDPPQGHLYGFPKIYDPDEDGPMHVWLREQGYPNPDYSAHVRVWSAENVQDN